MRQDLKKERSRMRLMDSAYELFTEIGFHKTTIAMIAKHAGLGKGTFYLYFRDKEDIRDTVIVQKSADLLQAAMDDTVEKRAGLKFYDRLIVITDYIIDYLSSNRELFKFISKSLGQVLIEDTANERGKHLMDMEDFICGILEESQVVLKNRELFIYTIIELINSTCYSPIVSGVPVTMEEYKPFLYHAIKLLTDDQVVSE